MIRSHKATLLAGLAVTATVFSGAGGVVAQDSSPAASGGASAVGVPATPTGYTELDAALGADQPYKGTKVTMQVQWITQEGDDFNAAMAAFQEKTGIQLSIAEVPSGQHETLVNVSLNGGKAADIIQLAQPSVVRQYGEQGLIKPIDSLLDAAKLKADLPTDAYASADHIWGIPYKAGLKSVVWYPIKAFEAKGYKVPETWDDLVKLSDQIVADGDAPWCVGIEASDATGWIITDWVEDVMIRTVGLEKYNEWVAGTLKFDSPEVKHAFDLVGQMLFTPGYVYGGSKNILATNQQDAMDPMFGEDGTLTDPQCWMQKQSDWYGPGSFPDAKATGKSEFVVGEDVGLFYFPEIDPAIGKPVLYAGDGFMATQDRPEVRAVAQFLATPSSIETWIKSGGAISPNKNTPAEWSAGNYKLETAASLIGAAPFLAFDGGDQMPPAVGAGSFWKQSVAWIQADGKNTEDVLKAIDATWPAQ